MWRKEEEEGNVIVREGEKGRAVLALKLVIDIEFDLATDFASRFLGLELEPTRKRTTIFELVDGDVDLAQKLVCTHGLVVIHRHVQHPILLRHKALITSSPSQ